MLAFIAEAAQSSIWPTVIDALASNGLWVFLGVCVVASTVKNAIRSVLKHRERIAMIEAGMEPDQAESAFAQSFAKACEKRSE